MPRTKENPRLSSRTAREDLPPRHEPFWLVLEKGRAIGYRKGTKGPWGSPHLERDALFLEPLPLFWAKAALRRMLIASRLNASGSQEGSR